MVERLDDYEHTSYRYYAFGESDELVSPSPAYLGLSDHKSGRQKIYSEYVQENRVEEEMMERGLLAV